MHMYVVVISWLPLPLAYTALYVDVLSSFNLPIHVNMSECEHDIGQSTL